MENQVEIWKDVLGYEGLYQVSNYGNVKSLNYLHHKGKKSNLKPNDNGLGYKSIILYKNGIRQKMYLHRIVLYSFIGHSIKQINHKDLDKSNNHLSNLEYVSAKQNIEHKMQHFEIIRDVKGRILTLNKK